MTGAPRLDVAIRRSLGAFALDVAFASDGNATALFGPSGAGKTSVANAILEVSVRVWNIDSPANSPPTATP